MLAEGDGSAPSTRSQYAVCVAGFWFAPFCRALYVALPDVTYCPVVYAVAFDHIGARSTSSAVSYVYSVTDPSCSMYL